MADQKMSAFTAQTTMADADEIVTILAAGGPLNRKITWANAVTQMATSTVAAYGAATLDIVGLWQTEVLTADRTNSTTSLADVTGLSFPVIANQKYQFRFVIDFTSAATTTGAGFALNGPALTRLVAGRTIDNATTSTLLVRAMAAYDTPAVGVATSAATAGNLAFVEGFIECSASGTVILRFVSEVDTSAIVVKAGSSVGFMRVT